MLVALLCGIIDAIDVQDRQSIPEHFKHKTGLTLESVYTSVLKWLAEQQSQTRLKTKRGSSPQKGHCLVIVTCLLFIRSSFGHVGTSLDQLRICVTIVSDYARVACEVLRSASPSRDQDERHCAVSIVFATASLLARITDAIPVSCPSDILQGISSIYKVLFDTKTWPIESCCVTSLVRFASTIPSVHQSILPACIPSNTQGLLQCRLQGLVFRGPGSHTEAMAVGVHGDCNRALMRLIPTLKSRDSLFAPTGDDTDTFVEGSYILTMPTANGRTAKVIFSPGDESLQDIKCMLGSEDHVEVRKLQQVRLIGKGCRFLSTVLEKS